MKRVLWAIFFFLVSVTFVNAASFDCGKASTKVEKMICASADLSTLDDDMSVAYMQAIDRIRESNNRNGLLQRFTNTQKQWLKNERNACQDVACIQASYERRLKEITFTPSFGFTFSRPNKIKLVPSPPLSQPVPISNGARTEVIAETEKIPVAQPLPASAVVCEALIKLNTTVQPKSELVSLFVEVARSHLEKKQCECAAQAMEQASQVLALIGDGAERAEMGFEIKEAVFAAIQRGGFSDHSYEKREIMAALQSMDTSGSIKKIASEDERSNDAAFLGRLADYYLEHRRQDNYIQVSSWMLILDSTLPDNRRVVDSSRMQSCLNVLAYKLALQDLAQLLDNAPNGMKNSLGRNIANTLRQPIYNHVLIGVTLLASEKAKQDLEALNKLLPVIEGAVSGQNDFWIWSIYRYLAEAYWQSGNKAKAREMIGKSRASILSAKSYPKGSSTALEHFATSLCKYIRIEIGKGAEMCPVGIYDANEMAALFDEVEKVARLAEDAHALATVGVLRKRLPGAAL